MSTASASDPLDDAIAGGIRYLEGAQLPSGEIPVATSSEPTELEGAPLDPSIFPTAMAVLALAPVRGADVVRERACAYLRREVDEHGLWRHWPSGHPQRSGLPPDVDDTALASAALAATGGTAPANRDLLLANRDRHGRFYTWVTPRVRWTDARHRRIVREQLRSAAQLYFFFNQTSASARDVDAVVNANVLLFLGVDDATAPAARYVADEILAGRELSCDKWYPNPFMVWYAAARALAASHGEVGDVIAQRIAGTVPRSATDVALAVSALAHLSQVADETSVDALIGAQRADGSWPAASVYFGGRQRLRGGRMAPAHPGTPHWGSAALSTALCVEALARHGGAV